MNKRILALLLAFAMLLSLAACGGAQQSDGDTAADETAQTEQAEGTAEAAETAENTDGAEEAAEEAPALTDEMRSDVVAYVTDGAIHMDDVVMTVDGVDITAGVFFYMLSFQYYQASSMYANYGLTLDLTQTMEDGETTMADYMCSLAKEDVQRHVLLLNKGQELKLKLTQEQEQQLAELSDYIDDTAALFYTSSIKDIDYATRASMFATQVNDYYYGENGVEAPTDETLADFADQHGFYTCRYILLRTDDLEEGDTEGKQAQQKQAQELYDQMKDLSGEPLLTKFAELQAEYNADGNTEPFSFDEESSLVEGFREKLATMKTGEIGLTDETGYGYFVLLRLEPDLTQVRSNYLSEMYNAKMEEWLSQSSATTVPALDELDMISVLGKIDTVQAAVAGEMSAQEQAAAEEEAEVMEEAEPAEEAEEADQTENEQAGVVQP